MAERVDLDAVQRNIERYSGLNTEEATVLVAELRVVREVIKDIRSALAPGRWRGFDGPDGVSKDEVIVDVATALMRYDRHTQPSNPDRSEATP